MGIFFAKFKKNPLIYMYIYFYFKGDSTTVVGYGQRSGDTSMTVKELQQEVWSHDVCVARFLLKNTDVKFKERVSSVFPNQFNGSLLCAGQRSRLGGVCPGKDTK